MTIVLANRQPRIYSNGNFLIFFDDVKIMHLEIFFRCSIQFGVLVTRSVIKFVSNFVCDKIGVR